MPNRLAREKSPYLLQHAENPVDWFPWGEEAFARARREQKPIFLSVGYSTCYWCHVMESNSFEQTDVAALLNAHFIPVKVDREERPDVDEVYMDAVIGMSGHGGWPMSVFLTPELKPFFGATFFWREQFVALLTKIEEAWRERRPEIVTSADEIVRFLARSEAPGTSAKRSEVLAHSAFEALSGRFDERFGGFGAAPKFPPAVQLSFLLRYARRTKKPEPLVMVQRTLDRMLRGGIYDQLGGGFARYATDERWIVPHFEKMLYDNALLVMTLLEAFQVVGSPHYAAAARETLDYLLREMTTPEGVFASAQDAGEVEKEGEFYVWDNAGLVAALGDADGALAARLFGVTPEGNFEHAKTVLTYPDDERWEDRASNVGCALRERLFAARQKRTPPLRDDKVLVGWNGLAIAALAKGHQVLGDERYLVAAQKAASFIKQTMHRNDGLVRRYRAGEASGGACLDDYAYLIDGLLHLYQSDFDGTWLTWAERLIDEQHARLWDVNGGGYFTSTAEELPVRKKETVDGAVPSGNAVTLSNYVRLVALTGSAEFHRRADRLWEFVQPALVNHPHGLTRALHVLDLELGGPVVVAVAGDGAPFAAFLKEFRRTFLPHCMLVASGAGPLPKLLHGRKPLDGKLTLYLCRGSECEMPTTDSAQLLQRVGEL